MRCKEVKLYPPYDFIRMNCYDGYKNIIVVDECLADEIVGLWELGIHTCGCCCGHGEESKIGFIQVVDDDIPKMRELGYEKYIYSNEFGGIKREDAFIPKSKCKCGDELKQCKMILEDDYAENYYKESMFKLLETIEYNIKVANKDYPYNIEYNTAKLIAFEGIKETIEYIILNCPNGVEDEN